MTRNFARRGAIVGVCGLAVVAISTTRISHQDNPAAGESVAVERAETQSVPILAKTHLDQRVAASVSATREAAASMAQATGIRLVEPPRQVPMKPRIVRDGKGGRVVAGSPNSALPPRGFSAGSILERQSLLGPRVVGGEERIRSAFSKVSQSTKDAMTVAMNFQLQGTPGDLRGGGQQGGSDSAVMLASLKPDAGQPPVDGTNALGYAPSGPETRTSTLFETILKEQPQAFIPPVSGDDHDWAATPLPQTAFSDKEQACLATGIYFEARGENSMGQAAVGQVILNRVRNPAFPDTICGVVYQNKNWHNRCQFSFACDGARDRVRDKDSFAKAQQIAGQVTRGEIWINEVGSATHYHANYVRPRWASAMEKVDKIGKHVFYRTYNGGW
ncbi:cell wall hydrolase [Aurantimonas sp. VKM B-3413]|uniref:cell wall hydrolase n=1 Tax=Aurantimonas sp. VKM B-3413 TaxID=2779401 RepID=UPI001E3D6A4A|nr:cell wall hydrolase [Aurantimonas sp. VKM B-3413]MCB8837777.1 cell wall hydrolase [Aurantimonas sp. VKM B-3413]